MRIDWQKENKGKDYHGSCANGDFYDINIASQGGFWIDYNDCARITITGGGHVETMGEYKNVMKLVSDFSRIERFMKGLSVERVKRLLPIVRDAISNPGFGIDTSYEFFGKDNPYAYKEVLEGLPETDEYESL